jgi:hypothetical protein
MVESGRVETVGVSPQFSRKLAALRRRADGALAAGSFKVPSGVLLFIVGRSHTENFGSPSATLVSSFGVSPLRHSDARNLTR